MTKIKKTLAIALLTIAVVSAGAGFSEVVKADAKPVYSAETMKSDNKDITYHWCSFIADCDDNCVENGFSIFTKDQDGEAYIFDKEFSDEDYTGAKFLVVTKYDKKNVISAYQITYKGLKSLTCPPYLVGGAL